MRRVAALLLICSGLLGSLPILGLWMLPVGLLLLAEDVPPLESVGSNADALIVYSSTLARHEDQLRPLVHHDAGPSYGVVNRDLQKPESGI
jgi:hypothetical protein